MQLATALRGWKAGGKWIREPGNLPTPGSIRRDARTLATGPTITLVLGGARGAANPRWPNDWRPTWVVR